MLVFNEGVPRSGKSYDAVLSHLLPSLKQHRRVYARLNGLSHDRIAAYLQMDVSHVQQLLTLVDTKDVRQLFACDQTPTGQWHVPECFKDALIIIDEVHEFYVNERRPLPPQIEQFWALLGQHGGDAVIMTQWINRLHSAVRARIERKTVFQKLSVLGMQSRYRATYYQTIAPGKFEKVGGKTLRYDPAIFPLYAGYADGAMNVQVYDHGRKSVWSLIGVKLVVALGVMGFATVFYLNFFRATSASSQTASQATPPIASPIGQVVRPGAPVASPTAVPPPQPRSRLSSEQQYIVDLSNKSRIRLAMLAQIGNQDRAMIEWVDSSNQSIEQLDLEDLRALGYTVSVESYGVRLSVADQVFVATNWPRIRPVRDPEARLYDTSENKH